MHAPAPHSMPPQESIQRIVQCAVAAARAPAAEPAPAGHPAASPNRPAARSTLHVIEAQRSVQPGPRTPEATALLAALDAMRAEADAISRKWGPSGGAGSTPESCAGDAASASPQRLQRPLLPPAPLSSVHASQPSAPAPPGAALLASPSAGITLGLGAACAVADWAQASILQPPAPSVPAMASLSAPNGSAPSPPRTAALRSPPPLHHASARTFIVEQPPDISSDLAARITRDAGRRAKYQRLREAVLQDTGFTEQQVQDMCVPPWGRCARRALMRCGSSVRLCDGVLHDLMWEMAAEVDKLSEGVAEHVACSV